MLSDRAENAAECSTNVASAEGQERLGLPNFPAQPALALWAAGHPQRQQVPVELNLHQLPNQAVR